MTQKKDNATTASEVLEAMLPKGAEEKAKKKVKRKRRDPSLPRHPLNSYNIYVKENRIDFAERLKAKAKEEGKDLTLTNPMIMKEMAQAWKEMAADDRKVYEAKSDEDRQRYEEQMRHLPHVPLGAAGLGGVAGGDKDDGKLGKRKRRDPLAPKHPVNMYNLFVKFIRPVIVEEGKLSSNPDIMREVVRRWQALPEDEKARYRQMAEDDKERYEKEQLEYYRRKVEMSSNSVGAGAMMEAATALFQGGTAGVPNSAAATALIQAAATAMATVMAQGVDGNVDSAKAGQLPGGVTLAPQVVQALLQQQAAAQKQKEQEEKDGEKKADEATSV